MYLLFGNFEGVELVEETETRGNDATSRNPPHSTTHASLTWLKFEIHIRHCVQTLNGVQM